MAVLLISVLFALIPLLGIAYILLTRDLFSVDGLFMSLILLSISGIFGLNTLLELKRRRAPKTAETSVAKPARAAAAAAVGAPAVQAAPARGEVRTETGLVVDLSYFEAPVGQANKSILTFQPNGAESAHLIVLAGDLRNALPRGKRVRITYTSAEEGNRLISAE